MKIEDARKIIQEKVFKVTIYAKKEKIEKMK